MRSRLGLVRVDAVEAGMLGEAVVASAEWTEAWRRIVTDVERQDLGTNSCRRCSNPSSCA